MFFSSLATKHSIHDNTNKKPLNVKSLIDNHHNLVETPVVKGLIM